jgi:hypothetical protein
LFVLRKGALLLGGWSGGGAGLPFAIRIWAQDKEDRDRSDDDTGDDDQQDRTAKGLSFFWRRGGGGGHGSWMQNVGVRNFLLVVKCLFSGVFCENGAAERGFLMVGSWCNAW